ncbi:hypothetical protein [Halalkalibacter oceani]
MNSYRVSRENFSVFQPILRDQSDVKAFRGAAQKGGDIIFTYEPGWTA